MLSRLITMEVALNVWSQHTAANYSIRQSPPSASPISLVTGMPAAEPMVDLATIIGLGNIN